MVSMSVTQRLPPYLPFSRFVTFLDRLKADNVPMHINREYYGSFLTGTDESYIINGFRFFDLLDSEGRPSVDLRDLALNANNDRKRVLANLIERYYANILDVVGDLSQVSREDLDAAFRMTFTAADTTYRKAETFFIQAALYAEIPLSSHLVDKTRARTASTRSLVGRRSAQTLHSNSHGQHTKGASVLANEDERSEKRDGDAKTVKLRSGGSVTLTISVNWFEIDKTERDFLIDLIDRLREHEERAEQLRKGTIRGEEKGETTGTVSPSS